MPDPFVALGLVLLAFVLFPFGRRLLKWLFIAFACLILVGPNDDSRRD